MKKSILVLLSVFLISFNHAQENQTPYSSDFEETILEHYKDSVPDVIDLLNTINYDEALHADAKKKIAGFVAELKGKNLLKKPLKKQIQTIYKTTHSKFLKKYDDHTFFNDIFKNGNYNCVTASALYTLIFDAFNINYSVRETPTHVYLIADTLGLQTMIESTLPRSGVLSFNDKYKKDFISYLNENKIISDAELQNASIETLFSKYYTEDKSINKYELAGIQYYNKGILLFDDENYSGAAINFKKALTIYPSNTIKFMHYASLQNALVKDYEAKTYNGKLFGQIVSSAKHDESLAELSENYFTDVSNVLCIQSPDIERYQTFFQDLLEVCPKEDIPRDILSKFHYFLAYNYGVRSHNYKALREIQKAYEQDQEDLRIRDLATNIGAKTLFIENNYKEQIDQMEKYFEIFPFLIKNGMYQYQYTYYFMKVMSDAFKFNKAKEGLAYYDRFLDAVSTYDLINYSEEHVSIGFSSAVYYYAKNRNFKKAIEFIEQGLDLVPQSNMLMEAKQQIAKQQDYDRMVRNYRRMDANRPEALSPREKLKQDLYTYFKGNWKAKTIIIEDMEQELTDKEVFELIAGDNKNCEYKHDGKTEKGKWAYRPVSQCIYFIPNNNKDNYKVFKVKAISENTLVLLPYKDQKKPSPYKYVLKLVE